MLLSQARQRITTELERRQKARSSLYHFTRYTMPTYEPAAMHRLICEKLDNVIEGRTKRLMIFTPPRHGKSELVSKRTEAYLLGRFPTKQVISASYGAELAVDFGREVRNIVSSRPFKALFPEVSLATDSSAKNRWHTNQGGSYVAVGVNGAITGRGADLLNIDDPVKDRAEAESPVIRKSTWDWYRSTAYTRLMKGGAVVLTMTRWHEDDLAGRLLAAEKSGGDRWEVLNLPAFNHKMQALWPERYDEDALNQIRAAIGDREFGSLFMQDPKPDGAAFFDVTNVLLSQRQPVAVLDLCDTVFATIDTAVKTGSGHDGTAVCYWAVTKLSPYKLVLLDWDIVQIEGSLLESWLPTVYQNLEHLARQHRALYGSLGTYIEDKASGTILLQQAARRGWQATAIASKLTAVGKDERAISVSGYVHRGLVKFGSDAYNKVSVYKGQSANHALTQIFGFRLGVKDQADDLLDCFTYGIAIALGNEEGY